MKSGYGYISLVDRFNRIYRNGCFSLETSVSVHDLIKSIYSKVENLDIIEYNEKEIEVTFFIGNIFLCACIKDEEIFLVIQETKDEDFLLSKKIGNVEEIINYINDLYGNLLRNTIVLR